MKPEVGSRYIMRNGKVTGVLENVYGSLISYTDGKFMWDQFGEVLLGKSSDYGLVEKYVEPVKPEPANDPRDITISDAINLSSKMFSKALETGDELMYQGAITIAELLKGDWK